MRTTITIHDELLETAKRHASERGVTLGALIEVALQRELAVREERSPPPEIPVFRGGTGPRPGVDLTSNRAIYEFLDEGVELDQRR